MIQSNFRTPLSRSSFPGPPSSELAHKGAASEYYLPPPPTTKPEKKKPHQLLDSAKAADKSLQSHFAPAYAPPLPAPPIARCLVPPPGQRRSGERKNVAG